MTPEKRAALICGEYLDGDDTPNEAYTAIVEAIRAAVDEERAEVVNALDRKAVLHQILAGESCRLPTTADAYSERAAECRDLAAAIRARRTARDAQQSPQDAPERRRTNDRQGGRTLTPAGEPDASGGQP